MIESYDKIIPFHVQFKSCPNVRTAQGFPAWFGASPTAAWCQLCSRCPCWAFFTISDGFTSDLMAQQGWTSRGYWRGWMGWAASESANYRDLSGTLQTWLQWLMILQEFCVFVWYLDDWSGWFMLICGGLKLRTQDVRKVQGWDDVLLDPAVTLPHQPFPARCVRPWIARCRCCNSLWLWMETFTRPREDSAWFQPRGYLVMIGEDWILSWR